jgi:hypothetical protein
VGRPGVIRPGRRGGMRRRGQGDEAKVVNRRRSDPAGASWARGKRDDHECSRSLLRRPVPVLPGVAFFAPLPCSALPALRSALPRPVHRVRAPRSVSDSRPWSPCSALCPVYRSPRPMLSAWPRCPRGSGRRAGPCHASGPVAACGRAVAARRETTPGRLRRFEVPSPARAGPRPGWCLGCFAELRTALSAAAGL